MTNTDNDSDAKTKTGRRPNIPHLNRVCDAIKAGSYDDDLLEIQKALSERRSVLEKDVLELVKQVFGPKAEVVAEPQVATQHHHPRPTPPSGNSFIDKARDDSEDTVPSPDPLSDLDDVERQMQSETGSVGRAGGGATINGLSASQIAD